MIVFLQENLQKKIHEDSQQALNIVNGGLWWILPEQLRIMQEKPSMYYYLCDTAFSSVGIQHGSQSFLINI